MDNKFVIVVPVYSEKPRLYEEVSLNRLSSVVGNKYPIKLVCPKSLSIDAYIKLLNITEDDAFRFNDEYFKSNETYSQLLVQYDFYNTFSNYEYMLIYQTDCYLIKDDIEKFCNLGFDYIGAPIISNHKVWKTAPTTGNGGLSLRKIETFKDICDPTGWFAKKYWDKEELNPKNVKIEDLYFCQNVYEYYDINKPIYNEEAVEFAIDMNPWVLMNILNRRDIDFPMGIHAWPKNILYWITCIPELNDKDIINCCLDSNNGLDDIVYRTYLKDCMKKNKH